MLDARVPHECGDVYARLLGRPHEDAQIGPPVWGYGRQQAPSHGPMVFAVVVTGQVQGQFELLLRLVESRKADLAVVLERSHAHPLPDESQACDARARPVQIAPSSPRIGFEEGGICAQRSGLGHVHCDGPKDFLHLRRIAPVPFRPNATQCYVGERPGRRGDLRA